MKGQADQYATGLLRERKAYVLVKVIKGDTEDTTVNIAIDGACIRTPEEDIKWIEEQKVIEANKATTGGKGAPPAKKK